MIRTHNIMYLNIHMEVRGKYWPAEPASGDYPGCTQEFDTSTVFVGGEDITHLLNHSQMIDIDRVVIDQHYS
jgi:hypothetical protein